MDGSEAVSLDDARSLIRQAESELAAVEEPYQEALRVRLEAIKKLNRAQEAFDRAVDDLRGFAAKGSTWSNRLPERGKDWHER